MFALTQSGITHDSTARKRAAVSRWSPSRPFGQPTHFHRWWGRTVLLRLAPLVAAVATLLGCASYRVQGPNAYEHKGIVVRSQTLQWKGSKLRLRFSFINRTDKEVFVDRDQMALVLPDGQVVDRFRGTFGGLRRATHRLPSGLSHNVFVDFKLEGDPPSTARLQLAGVVSEGRPIELPDYELQIIEE